MGGWVGGWVGGGCFLTIRLSQPSLAGVRDGAELGNYYPINPLKHESKRENSKFIEDDEKEQ